MKKFADLEVPTLDDFVTGSVAWVIQRYIDEMDGARGAMPVKPLGESHRCTLRVLQRMRIGGKAAAKLNKQDIVDLCKELRKKRCAATANQYLTYLRGALNYAGSAWIDCESVSSECITKAKHLLRKYQMIGKSTPRKVRPQEDQIPVILEALAERDKHATVINRMADIFAFSLVSSRRRGEIVRITHGDVDYERMLYWVRDLKHPTKKKGNDKYFILWPELAAIIKRQPRLTPDNPQERIFPFKGESVGKAYIDVKKALGIKNLRFHDNRREAISRWLLKMPPEDVARCVSGHEGSKILERNYDGRDPIEIMQEKYAPMLQQQRTA